MSSPIVRETEEGIFTRNCVGSMTIRDVRSFYDLVTDDGKSAYVYWDGLPYAVRALGEVSGLRLRYDYGRSPEKPDKKRALNIRGVIIRPGLDSTKRHRTPTHRAVVVHRLIHYGIFFPGTEYEKEVEIGYEQLPEPLTIRSLAEIPREWKNAEGYDLKELTRAVLGYMGSIRAIAREVMDLAEIAGFLMPGIKPESANSIVQCYAPVKCDEYLLWELRCDTGATAREIVDEAALLHKHISPANQLHLIQGWLEACDPDNQWTRTLKADFEEAWRMWYRDGAPEDQPKYARVIAELALRILFLSLFNRFKGILSNAKPEAVINGMLDSRRRWRKFNITLGCFEQECGGFAPEVYAYIQDHLRMGAAQLHSYGFRLEMPPTLEELLQASRRIDQVDDQRNIELADMSKLGPYRAVLRVYGRQPDHG